MPNHPSRAQAGWRAVAAALALGLPAETVRAQAIDDALFDSGWSAERLFDDGEVVGADGRHIGAVRVGDYPLFRDEFFTRPDAGSRQAGAGEQDGFEPFPYTELYR